ncbi:D-alanyl-D-alanine carboxypeptidase/D-alanyl-D-alanine endopeptidase [Shewanella sp. HL-SH4]|uniref:D-alanyl-D-alanine carboxypeptidase/D-alanyl-D-alanine endopeptidase n=1 Tax=Shewanella sp. HL-SH4 TaxID=3436240 RepID=UPI003EB8C0C0
MRLHKPLNLFITALVLFCLDSSAQQVLTHTQIEQDSAEDQLHVAAIMNLIKPESSLIALSVWDLADNRSVFKQNSNALMNPASIQKLLTALVSAKQLGQSFQYRTQLLSEQKLDITNGILKNELFVTFSGDPTLKQRHLITLINQLKQAGVHTVNGNIHLIGHHQDQLQAPGWVWDDLGICYAAPISSFIIDKNCVFARLSANGYNKKATLKVMGKRPIYVENEAVFAPYQPSAIPCDLQLIRKDSNHFTLKGCYAGAKSLPLAIAINEPQGYAVNVVKAIFKQQKIRLTGKVVVDTTLAIPNGELQPIATHLSAPLPKLIDEMLLKSDNLMAEALLRTSAEDFKQQPLNFKQTTQALVVMLRELGIELEMANIADGSGLSRYNLLSAEHVMAVLKVIATDQDYQYLLGSLPVAGIKGTLKYKRYFTKPPLKFKVMAKTGSMLGVSNLAGQFQASNGKMYLFVLIENGLSPKIKRKQKAPFSAILLQNLMDMPLVRLPN